MKSSLKQFKLKRSYFTSVEDNKYVVLENLVSKIIIEGDSYGIKDHPEFTNLRNKLEKQGYIQIERGWWNGDRVIKPFSLNGIKFKKYAKFPCASALNIQLNIYEQTKSKQKIKSKA